MVRVIKTQYSDVVIISEGIKGNAPFVIPLTELDDAVAELQAIATQYRDQIDKAIDYRAKQTEEITRLLEPVSGFGPSPAESLSTKADEFNAEWRSFERDLTGAQRRWYLELSQANKQKAFEHWTRTQGEHYDYKELAYYQLNYEQ